MGRKNKITPEGRTRLTSWFWRGHSYGYRYMIIFFKVKPKLISHVFCHERDLDKTMRTRVSRGGVFEIYDLDQPVHRQLKQRRAWNVASVCDKTKGSK